VALPLRTETWRIWVYRTVCGLEERMNTWAGPAAVPSMRTLRVRFMTSAPHWPFTSGWARRVGVASRTEPLEDAATALSSKPL